jgi:hypothetical protein
MNNGKGSKRRPTNEAAYRENYAKTFGPALKMSKKSITLDGILKQVKAFAQMFK